MLDVQLALLARFGAHTEKQHYQLLEFSLRLLLDAAPGASIHRRASAASFFHQRQRQPLQRLHSLLSTAPRL